MWRSDNRALKSAVLALASCLAAMIASAQQRTFVSAKSGNDANACTLASPCRNFQRAVDAVVSGGEVIPLDSGGYGSVIIQKSVTISVPNGIYGGITTTTGDYAIAISAPGGTVNLQGLTMNNVGGNGGVFANPVGRLRVDSCVISNAQFAGITFLANGVLESRDCVITGGGAGGIRVNGPDAAHPAHAEIDHARISASSFGFVGFGNVDISVTNSMSFNNTFGFQLNGENGPARMSLENCVSHANDQGLVVDGPVAGPPENGTMFVSNCVVTNNRVRGIWIRQGNALSRGNNTVEGNPAGTEVFTATFASK